MGRTPAVVEVELETAGDHDSVSEISLSWRYLCVLVTVVVAIAYFGVTR